ncbi:MAG TPA: 30S ribosomal protein S9 [Chloroflexi bacterium]|jgi:small subunit ribosomal protein S9|nr:30S ribosomal protein S9 [Chloroflexota bacterium]
MAVQQYFAAVGRRKTSVARARIMLGTGEIIVNGKPLELYFGGSLWTAEVQEPFHVAGQFGRYNSDVKVLGGGLSGQAGAIRHAISRALVQSDESLKPQLRKAGLLTRDARMKERKKYGLKRARKAPQYTKR